MSAPTTPLPFTATDIPMGHTSEPSPPEQICTSGKAIASLVCGIIGILIAGIIFGPLAIILGVLAKKEINQNPRGIQGKGQATAGIVCGIIAIIVWLIIVIVMFG